MTQRPLVSDAASRNGPSEDLPSPEIVAFISYCHRRRAATWPELYDEMCGVAARREFHGWDQEELGRRGLSFTLFEMPKLAVWTRAVLATSSRPVDAVEHPPVKLAPRPAAG